MSLPSAVGLPAEMQLGTLDYSLPSDAKSFSVRVQPTNLFQITSSAQTLTASTVIDNIPFPSQSIIFDIPAGSNPSTFLDNRMTTLNFRATTVTTGANSATISNAYLRSVVEFPRTALNLAPISITNLFKYFAKIFGKKFGKSVGKTQQKA